MPHLLPPLPFSFALSEHISALLLLLAQTSANVSTLVITEPLYLHWSLHSLSTCPWLYLAATHTAAREERVSWCGKSYKTGEGFCLPARGRQNFRDICPQRVWFVQDRIWNRACTSKVFCILFENAKTCHGPHTCLPTSCLARRSSRLDWLPAQLQARLSLRISFSPWSTVVPFPKDPKP